MSQIVFNPPKPESEEGSVAALQSQIENLQTTLASLNQQVIILQEALQERDQEIADLKTKLSENTPQESKSNPEVLAKQDETLTIVGAVINLYQFAFPSGKDSAAPNQ